MAEVNFLVKKGLTVPKGSASTPAIIFDAADTDCGLFSPAANQVAISVQGSASAPALSFGSDSNTGIYSPGADQVAISTNGTGRLFVDASGNIVVSGGGQITSRNVGSSPGKGLIQLGESGSWQVEGLDTGYGGSGAYLKILSGVNERLRITSDGKLGLGTSSPNALIEAVTTKTSTVETGAVFRTNGTGVANDVNRILLQLPNTAGNTTGGAGIGAVLQATASNKTGLALYYGNASAVLTEAVRIDGDGNVGIGTTSPSASALLDVSSTTQGLLPPRMTSTQRDAISSPAAGLMIYNTTTNKLNFYNGTAWEAVTSA